MIEGKGLISIWFFIGVLLLAYGVIITGAGIYHLFVPPEHEVVLAHLHAAVWWGAFVLLMGIFYCVRFFPRRDK
jgi:uncharacterized membrane protein HdeD (DUF308 family)